MGTFDYEDGVKATVAEHKRNICQQLRDVTMCSDWELAERGYLIEELGRFLDKLYEDYRDGDVIEVVYSDGLNYFKILEDD